MYLFALSQIQPKCEVWYIFCSLLPHALYVQVECGVTSWPLASEYKGLNRKEA